MKKPEMFYAKMVCQEKPKHSEGVKVYSADEMDAWLKEKLDGMEKIIKKSDPKPKDSCRKCKYYMSKEANSGYCMRWSDSPQWIIHADKCGSDCTNYHNPEDEL